MAKNEYIKTKIDPKGLTVIQPIKVKVVDPIRYPEVIEPIEKLFMKHYAKMTDNMIKMLGFEIIKQIRSK